MGPKRILCRSSGSCFGSGCRQLHHYQPGDHRNYEASRFLDRCFRANNGNHDYNPTHLHIHYVCNLNHGSGIYFHPSANGIQQRRIRE